MKNILLLAILVPGLSFADTVLDRYDFGDVVVEVSGRNEILGTRDQKIPFLKHDPIGGKGLPDKSLVIEVTDMVATRTVTIIGKSGEKRVLKTIESSPFGMTTASPKIQSWAASVLDVQIFDGDIHVLSIRDGQVASESFSQSGTPASDPDPIMKFAKHHYVVKSMKFEGSASKLSIDMCKRLKVIGADHQRRAHAKKIGAR